MTTTTTLTTPTDPGHAAAAHLAGKALAGLSDLRRAAILELAGDDPGAQLRAVDAVGPSWAAMDAAAAPTPAAVEIAAAPVLPPPPPPVEVAPAPVELPGDAELALYDQMNASRDPLEQHKAGAYLRDHSTLIMRAMERRRDGATAPPPPFDTRGSAELAEYDRMNSSGDSLERYRAGRYLMSNLGLIQHAQEQRRRSAKGGR